MLAVVAATVVHWKMLYWVAAYLKLTVFPYYFWHLSTFSYTSGWQSMSKRSYIYSLKLKWYTPGKALPHVLLIVYTGLYSFSFTHSLSHTHTHTHSVFQQISNPLSGSSSSQFVLEIPRTDKQYDWKLTKIILPYKHAWNSKYQDAKRKHLKENNLPLNTKETILIMHMPLWIICRLPTKLFPPIPWRRVQFSLPVSLSKRPGHQISGLSGLIPISFQIPKYWHIDWNSQSQTTALKRLFLC